MRRRSGGTSAVCARQLRRDWGTGGVRDVSGAVYVPGAWDGGAVRLSGGVLLRGQQLVAGAVPDRDIQHVAEPGGGVGMLAVRAGEVLRDCGADGTDGRVPRGLLLRGRRERVARGGGPRDAVGETYRRAVSGRIPLLDRLGRAVGVSSGHILLGRKHDAGCMRGGDVPERSCAGILQVMPSGVHLQSGRDDRLRGRYLLCNCGAAPVRRHLIGDLARARSGQRVPARALLPGGAHESGGWTMPSWHLQQSFWSFLDVAMSGLSCWSILF